MTGHSQLVQRDQLCQQNLEVAHCNRETLERLAEGLPTAEAIVLVCIAAQLLDFGNGDCILKDHHVRHLAAGLGAWVDGD